MLRVLLSTVIFPNRFETNRGIYIKKLISELAQRDRVTISVPIPYVPPFLKHSARGFYAKLERRERLDGLEVYYPRFVIIPKIFRFLHGPFLFLSVFPFYRRLVRRERPQILLGFWTFPDGFANVLMARILGLPVVIGCLGSDVNQLTRPRIQRALIAWALCNSDRVISVSGALKQEIVKRLGVPPEKVTVMPNGIETDRFEPLDRDEMRKKLGLEPAAKIAVCVARLEPVKGVDLLIRAFAEIPDEACRLVVVGDGGERKRLEGLVSELGVAGRVRLVGDKPHGEIPFWMNAADLLVLSSRTEGWPNVLMEAFSCGKPVVAFRVGGVPEIVNDSELGILVPPGDTERLARAIEEGLQRQWDPSIIRRRVAGRSWAVVAEELHQLLQDVVEQRSSPSGLPEVSGGPE